MVIGPMGWCRVVVIALVGLLVCGCPSAPRVNSSTTTDAPAAEDDQTTTNGQQEGAGGDSAADADSNGTGGTDGHDADTSGLDDGDDVSPDTSDDTSEPEAEDTILGETPEDDLLDGTANAEHLDTLTLAHVRVGGQVFLVWIADHYLERERGLMYVTEEEMAPLEDGRRRGMLFVYGWETDVGYWMRNTIIPLDIAYIRADGVIDSIRTMEPLDETGYPPDGPYQFALEVNAGTFAELGVQAGDVVELPDDYRAAGD